MSRRWLVGVALLVAAQGAHAQDPLAIPGVDAGTIAQLRQIVAATAERGLPVDPIVGEARFAALRRVAAPTLIDAAKRVAERLEIARTALKPEPTPADIAAGAEALKYGVPPDALTAIRAARDGRPVAVPLGVLTQLVASHVPVKRASAIVLDLIRRGADATQLADLGNAVNTDIARGRRPEESLDWQLQSLNALLAPPGGAVGDVPSAASGRPKKP